MSDKSAQKRQYIVETARNVFREKGYKSVTMKDIVEACDISRGGLYLYFGSTKELFQAVLELETKETDDVFSDKVTEDATAADILALFLKEQKKEIIRQKNTLTVAIYEYFFENKVPKKENLLRRQFDMAVKVIQALIEEGVNTGEFYCDSTLDTARTIVLLLEGLKIASQTMAISEDMVNKELLFILQGLIIEE